jgi:hypothetical protein
MNDLQVIPSDAGFKDLNSPAVAPEMTEDVSDAGHPGDNPARVSQDVCDDHNQRTDVDGEPRLVMSEKGDST